MIPEPRLSYTGPGGKPRASGDDPEIMPYYNKMYEVNPARAGMIRPFAYQYAPYTRKPRASGDDPSAPEGCAGGIL